MAFDRIPLYPLSYSKVPTVNLVNPIMGGFVDELWKEHAVCTHRRAQQDTSYYYQHYRIPDSLFAVHYTDGYWRLQISQVLASSRHDILAAFKDTLMYAQFDRRRDAMTALAALLHSIGVETLATSA